MKKRVRPSSIKKGIKPGIKLTKKEEQKIREMSEVSLWLDGYDDIFSDFDTRSYAKRSVSDDFIYETKKFTKKKYDSEKLTLTLFVPAIKRSVTDEFKIRKRLNEHFRNHYNALKKEKKIIIGQGSWFAAIGMVLMIATSYTLFKFPEKNFLASFIITLFEPASWFLFWEGLRLIVFDSKQKTPDLEFYERMNSCRIQFYSY